MEWVIDEYTSWLKENTAVLAADGDWREIVTPFLKFNNDNIEVYSRLNKDGSVTFADGKETLRELAMAGLGKLTKGRQREIDLILRAKGIKLTGEELTVTVPRQEASAALHRFIQATMEVLDLQVLSQDKVYNFFKEDLAEWLSLNDIAFFTNTVLYGKSGLPSTFDFALPRIGKRPEQLIQAVTSPRRDLIMNTIMVINDVLRVKRETSGLIVLNDTKEIKPELEQAIAAYDVPFVRFSQKDQLLEFIQQAA